MHPVIKWSGSKRSQAEAIKAFIDKGFGVWHEPFVGGGAMLYALSPRKAICGDMCAPLIALWNAIKTRPRELAAAYRLRWQHLQTEGPEVFYAVRNNFNAQRLPEDLLFLSRTCVNGLIRFNINGEFNNSFHHTRKGIHPDRLEAIIQDWSGRIRNTVFHARDYADAADDMAAGDLVYLDPPYFHTKGQYYGKIDYERFFAWLERLNLLGVRYLLSFDGARADRVYPVTMPQELYKRHVLLASGHSGFKKVMNRQTLPVMESLYLNW